MDECEDDQIGKGLKVEMGIKYEYNEQRKVTMNREKG